jgi:Fur family transcriptional regulator, ferric uptake regulator
MLHDGMIGMRQLINVANVADCLARRAVHDPARAAVCKAVKYEYDNRRLPIPTGTRVSSPNDLKTIGLKATLPRLRILELFEKSSVRHLSAEDIYKTLSKDGTDTGLATVYRVLTQFEQAGLLIRHHFETGKAVFELNQGGHHDHLVCVQCGHVEEFFDAEIEKRQERIAKDRGYKIHDHSLHIYADCTRQNCPHRNR